MPAAAGAVRRHTCSARAGARQPVSTWKPTQSKTRARGVRSFVSWSAASTRPATGWTGSMTSSRCSTCSMTWRITPARLPPWPRPRCQAPGWRSSTTSTAATVRQARWPTRTARLCPIPSSGRMSRAPWGAGWRLESLREIDADYVRWYVAFAGEIEAKREAIEGRGRPRRLCPCPRVLQRAAGSSPRWPAWRRDHPGPTAGLIAANG